ncbi:MAG: DUF4932 domain-containing protein [Acidobacteria bacterium]|nr:MAG: DUF4932 domain-containing protein [Acidobacteriota bacterium]
MRRFPIRMCIGVLTLLGAIAGPLAAELPYITQARHGRDPGGEPRMIITASAQVELVTLVAARADYQRSVNPPQADNPLGTFWNQRSRPFGIHDAPRHLRELRNHGLWGDRLLEFALHLSSPPALERVIPWSSDLLDAARGESMEDPAGVLDQLRLEIKDFGEKVRFNDHFSAKEADYGAMVAGLESMLEGQDPMAQNAAFWGVKPGGDLYLIPSPLMAGGYLASIKVGSRTHQFLAFGPALAVRVVDANFLDHLLNHELSHLIVDPILRAHVDGLDASSALWRPLAQRLRSATHVVTWTDGIGEHLLRAYNIYLVQQEDPVQADLYVSTEEAGGYIYTRPFLGILSEYAGDRERWPSLEAYMPTLVERLAAMAEKVRDLDPSTRVPDFQLSNAGFEEGGGAWIARDWMLVRAGDLPGKAAGSFTEVRRDTQVAHEGTASLRLRIGPDTTGLVAVEQGPLAVRSGGTVRASAWVKTEEVQREGIQQKVCGLYVIFFNRSGEVISRGESDSAVGTLDWTLLSAEFVAPADTVRAGFGILLGMSGTAWFDDVDFERVD